MSNKQTSPLFAAPIPLKQQNAKLVKTNDTFPDSTYPLAGVPTFASTPTRYNNSNQIFGLEQITCDYAMPSYPDFLGAHDPNYEFFNSRQPVAQNLPSTINANRYK